MKSLFLALWLALASGANADSKFMDQTWFAYWGGGPMAAAYPDSFYKLISGSNRVVSFSMDVWGFYWPLPNRKTVLGVVGHGDGDTWTNFLYSTQQVQLLYAISGWHSLSGELGDGWFLRGDLGPVMGLQSIALASSSNSQRDFGYGADLGGGYLFGKGDGTRIPLTLLYSPKMIKGELFQTVSLLVGVLW